MPIDLYFGDQVAYYASGEHVVPRTVLLACKGWEVERQAAA